MLYPQPNILRIFADGFPLDSTYGLTEKRDTDTCLRLSAVLINYTMPVGVNHIQIIK